VPGAVTVDNEEEEEEEDEDEDEEMETKEDEDEDEEDEEEVDEEDDEEERKRKREDGLQLRSWDDWLRRSLSPSSRKSISSLCPSRSIKSSTFSSVERSRMRL